MKLWGLTGGIGAGKSTVARFLREQGVVVIDADTEAKRLSSDISRPVYQRIVDRFGVRPDPGERGKLAEIIFNDPAAKRDLEGIIYPELLIELRVELEHLAHLGNKLVVIEAATLVEAGWERYMSGVLYVIAPGEDRMRRIRERDATTLQRAFARMRNQGSINEAMLKLASYPMPLIVIPNWGTEDDLQGIVWDLANKLVNVPGRTPDLMG